MTPGNKFVILFTLLIALLFSCSEDESELKEEYYFRFKVDGELFDYKLTPDSSNIYGRFNHRYNDGFYTTAIHGSKTFRTENDEALTIVILDTARIKLNTVYTNIADSGPNPFKNFSIIFKYEGYYYYTRLGLEFAGIQPDGQFVVTYKDDKIMRGTFSSTLLKDNAPSETLKLTDGEFSVSTKMRPI